MRRRLPPAARWAALALASALAPPALAQPPGSGAGPPPVALPPLPPLPSTGPASRPPRPPGAARPPVARVAQAPEPSPPPGERVPGGFPERNTTDLAAPAAEREFGGGEPTTSEAAAEENAGAEGSATPEEKQQEGEGEAEEKKDERGLLMKFLDVQEDAGFKVYGWIQNSFTGNPSMPSDKVNFGVNPNFKANQWMGNQYYLILERPLDPEKSNDWQWGFRFDNLFGNDWQFNHMNGVLNNAFVPGRFAGYDPAQFYGEAHLPVLTEGGLDVKFGRWYTLHGYEVVPAVGRPLLSVPYMFNYGQPFTHWGLMTTLHYNDQINIYNGTTNGWDRFQNQHYRWGYMGGISWTSKDTRTNLTTIYSFGPNQYPTFLGQNVSLPPTGSTPIPFLAGRRNLGYANNWRTLFTTVLTHKWTDKLTQVMETDEAFESNVPGTGPGGTAQNAEWYSFGNWFLYQFDKDGKWTGVWRSEVFRDDDGVRTGFADNFYEMTLGMIWKPKPYIWVRPETRYDWAQFSRPYNGGNSKSQFTIGFDVIFLF